MEKRSEKSTKQKKKVKKKKGFSIKLFILFIIFEIIFTGITAPFLVFYGPFENVKSSIVGAAMSTLSHQYIAKAFLSDEEINNILKGQSVSVISQNVSSDTMNNIKASIKHDDNIERYDIEDSNYKGYLLIIHDPDKVKVGYSSKLGTEGERTSEIAERSNAIAAINGGAFTDKSTNDKWVGTGAQASGILISNGVVVHSELSNDNEKTDVMALTDDGCLLVGPHSMKEMKRLKVRDAVTFGPALIVNGEKTVKNGNGGQGTAPRTAIGQRKDGAILMLVIDGRQLKSIGATLKEVQDVLYKYGAYNATNLDGGSSSTMYFDGEVINNPCDSLGERAVPSAVYVSQ